MRHPMGQVRCAPLCGQFWKVRRRWSRFSWSTCAACRRIPFTRLSMGRLIPGPHWTTRGWFRLDRPILQRVISWSRLRAPEDVVQELMALFREVEEFWDTGRVGQHIRLLPNPVSVRTRIAGQLRWNAHLVSAFGGAQTLNGTKRLVGTDRDIRGCSVNVQKDMLLAGSR